MDIKEFLTLHLIPTIERDYSEGGVILPRVCFLLSRGKKERSILDQIEKYEEESDGVIFTDQKINPPYDLSTHEHIFKSTCRLLFPDGIITSCLNELPHKEQMNNFYAMFEKKENIEPMEIEVIFSLETYEKNERFVYKLEGNQLVLKDTLIPLERTYLPYLN